MMKVLVLDSDKKMADRIHECFESLSYQVSILRSREKVISCLKSQEYAGLIVNLDCDHHIFSLIKKIRECGIDLPILVYGYFLTDLSIDQCQRIEYCDFIKRPFSKVEFEFRVRFLFARYEVKGKVGTIENECVKINGYLFYPNSYKIWTDDQVVKLTRRENELLRILAYNIRNVVSKAQILDAIWGNQKDLDENLVAVYVSKLRRLFLDNNIDIRIDTVKNVGYSLIS